MPDPTTFSANLPPPASREDAAERYVQLQMLKKKLSEERRALTLEVQNLRAESVRVELASEVEEENVANRLIRKVEREERDIQRFEKQIVAEEDSRNLLTGMLRNAIQEQSSIENQLEASQELFLLTLQRQMVSVAQKNSAMESELRHEQQRYLTLLSSHMHNLSVADSGCLDTPLNGPESPNSELGSPRSDYSGKILATLQERINGLIRQNEVKTKLGEESGRLFEDLTAQFFATQEEVSRKRQIVSKLRRDLHTLRSRLAAVSDHGTSRRPTSNVYGLGRESNTNTPESLSLAQTPISTSRLEPGTLTSPSLPLPPPQFAPPGMSSGEDYMPFAEADQVLHSFHPSGS